MVWIVSREALRCQGLGRSMMGRLRYVVDGLRYLIVRMSDPKALDPTSQSIGMQVKYAGGPLWPLDDPSRLFQHRQNMALSTSSGARASPGTEFMSVILSALSRPGLAGTSPIGLSSRTAK